MLGEDVDKEVMRELFCCAGGDCWNEYGLFGKMVNDYQDGVEVIRDWKWFNEVHGNGFPWVRRNWELLECSIRLVELGLGLHTSRARLAVIPNITAETRPVEFLSD